jgi:hypothetical protein
MTLSPPPVRNTGHFSQLAHRRKLRLGTYLYKIKDQKIAMD